MSASEPLTGRPGACAEGPRSAEPAGGDSSLAGGIAAALETLNAASPKPDDIRAVLSAAVHWYASAVEASGQEFRPVDATISATEAVTLACALLRSQDLTPFDLALWFSRGAPASGEQ